MKKFFIGLLCGLILATGATAYADEIKSVIGKSVEAEYPVSINGSTLETPAIIVNETGYLPVRAIANAIGYETIWDDKEGITLNKSIKDKDAFIEQRNKEVRVQELAVKIPAFEKTLVLLNETYTDPKVKWSSEESKKNYLLDIERTEKQLNDMKVELEALKAELETVTP